MAVLAGPVTASSSPIRLDIMRLALIQDGVVLGVILLDEGGTYEAPPGVQTLEVDDFVSANDLYDGQTFTRPEFPSPEETVTLGQLIDIGTQLGLVPIDAIVALLPISVADITQDPDGSIVVRAEKVDAVVQEAIDKGSIPPRDIPPTPDEVGEIEVTP
jgi:hypothetical protein